jgi:outer membrane protein assembly factor BamB
VHATTKAEGKNLKIKPFQNSNTMKLKRNQIILIIAFIISSLCFILVSPLFNANMASATTSDDWPMFGHDPSHSGSSNSTGPLSIYQSDNYQLGRFNDSDRSFCVVAGVVYVGSDPLTNIVNNTMFHYGVFYAVDAKTGAKIWSYTTDTGYSPPCVADGTVYVGSGDKVFAFNAISGEIIWTFTGYSADLFLSAPCVVNGVVYFGSDSGILYALNAKTGAKIWSYQTEARAGYWSGVDSSPSVVNDIVYFGARNGIVYALNAGSGEKIWEYATGNAVWSSPCVANGVVYIGSTDDNVYALNAASGAKIWNYSTGYWVTSSPCFANGAVYVGSLDHCVYALNAISGAKIWNFTTGDGVPSSPCFANGVIYVGSEDGKVYALNAASGEKIWSYYTTTVAAAPCIANGVVYVVAYNGYLYAFRDLPDQLYSTVAVVVSIVALIIVIISLWIFYARKKRKKTNYTV